jgi:hypothetical protein
MSVHDAPAASSGAFLLMSIHAWWPSHLPGQDRQDVIASAGLVVSEIGEPTFEERRPKGGRVEADLPNGQTVSSGDDDEWSGQAAAGGAERASLRRRA